ncbi:B12-binding domain-containing radical SAM protein [bacterium]|nr:B12-binding domain-containing radical SAM protein [candidate division CSSED10-310 bacterium]
MTQREEKRILFMRPPYTRLKKLGQAPYFPLGIGYLTAVLNNLDGVQARLYYPENPSPQEKNFIIDKRSVFNARSYSQKLYFEALEQESHPVWLEIQSVLREYKPHILGLSVLTPETGSALKITRLVKELLPETTVVWGGVHPSFTADQTISYPGVDYIVIGEGEETFKEFVSVWPEKSIMASIPGVISKNTQDRNIFCKTQLIRDLDSIPFPARDHTMFPHRFSPVALGSLMHSRGCPWRCGFCSSRQFWQERVRFRKPEYVTEEIKKIIADYGIRIFTFWDDAFTADRFMTEQLCECILKIKTKIAWRTATRIDLLDDSMLKLMKRAGCVQLELGIETGSPRMLDIIRKDINLDDASKAIDRVHKHGMACGVFFMAGFPDETREDLLETFNFMQKIKPAEIVLNIFDPMPGSEQFERAVALDLLPRQPDYAHFQLWPDAHYVANIKPGEFNSIVEKMSHYVFEYNSSRAALIRRAKPEIVQLLRTDRKVLFQKSMRFLKHHFFGSSK